VTSIVYPAASAYGDDRGLRTAVGECAGSVTQFLDDRNQPGQDNDNENLDGIVKASRSLLEACLQGHLAVGPVTLACLGLAGAGLAAVGKLMSEKAADLDDPDLRRAAGAINGLGRTAGAVSTVDGVVAALQDPIGSAEHSLVNTLYYTPDPAKASSTENRIKNAVKKLQDIGDEDS
jgi:hypothetical protein